MKNSLVKEHIIQTASKLFYEKGYNLTGVNEIIKVAGIAKATLYSHFKSKEDLCIAFLKYKNTSFLEDIKAHTKMAKIGKVQILALFDFLKDFFNTNDFNGCWCINTVSEIPHNNINIKAEIKAQKLIFLKFIETLITDNTKGLDNSKIESLAKQIYVLYEGSVAESHLHNAIWPIEFAQKTCEKLLN